MQLIAKQFAKDLDAVTIDDIKQVVSQIQQRTDYSAWTRKDYKGVIKRFYKWQTQTTGRNKFPPIVDWINTTMRRCDKKLVQPSELHQENDIGILLNATDNSRDRAMVAMLWESGARIGEIGTLSIGDISFDKYGIVFSVQGKTGSRKIRLIASTPYVASWLNDHPLKQTKTAPLWVAFSGKDKHKLFKYRAIRKMLADLASKAGVTKRSNPHIFRHSRATFMASHLTEFQMNEYFGWIQGSDMAGTYVHMNGKNVENAIFKINGLATEQQQRPQQMTPKICARCDLVNTYNSVHCSKCGALLDLKVALELDEKRSNADKLMEMLLQDVEVKTLVMQKLAKMGQ